MVKESLYFNTKSEQQRDQILMTLGLVAKGQQYEEYMHATLTLDDFVNMRKIIDCMGDKRSIVEFVDRYLPYDEYGELSKG